MNIIMFSSEYFPPNKMHANHNRLLNLAHGLNKKHKVTIICPNNKYNYNKIMYKNIPIIRFPIINIKIIGKIFMILFAHRYLTKILKKEKIHMDILWYNTIYAWVLSKKVKCTKIYDVMGLIQSESTKKDDSFKTKIKQGYYRKTENIALANADYITTVNNAHKKEIEKLCNTKTFVIRDGYNQIFLNKYTKKNTNNITIMFVGSFFKDRLNGIIDKLPELIKNNNLIFFEIIGDGKYISKYKNLINKYNCEKNVKFKGYLDNLEVYENLKEADICFSDDWSYIGFPTKVFEYMAMGKAVLVEDTPAVREIVKENINGLLYKDANDFAKKVVLLSKNKRLRHKLGKNALITAKENTWDLRQKEYNAVLKRIK